MALRGALTGLGAAAVELQNVEMLGSSVLGSRESCKLHLILQSNGSLQGSIIRVVVRGAVAGLRGEALRAPCLAHTMISSMSRREPIVYWHP